MYFSFARGLVAGLLLVACIGIAEAQNRIDQLNPGSPISGSDLFPACQGCNASTNMVSVTPAQWATYFNANLSLNASAITAGTLAVARGGTGITSFGTGVATALGINVGSAGAFVVFNGALGTPSSGTATNLTGTAAGLTSGLSTAALGLKTASTTVSISSATAPSAGQVLTATSGTAADWETPTGGGSITATAGGNTQTGITTLAFGNGFTTTNGSSGTAPINLTASVLTKTADFPVTATQMAGGLVFGSGTYSAGMTLPAASSTIFAPGMTMAFAVTGANNLPVTNSTGLTTNLVTTAVPGTNGTLVADANGTALDFFGIQTPTATTIGGSLSLAAASNQFLTGLGTDGVYTRAQPAFTNLSGVASVAQLGGSAASHAVPVDVAGTSTYKVIPDCVDSGGNHINFTQSTDAFSCGTSGGSGGSGTPAVGNTTPVTVNANTTGDQLLQELHPANGAFNTSNMVIRLHQSGIFTTAAISTPTITVKAKLCSSSNSGCITLASITTAATVTATNNQFVFETSCGVSATGASGTLTCHGTQFADLTASSVVAATYTDANTAASSAFDLTGANFIDFTIAFSAASASNAATGQLAYEAPQGFGGTVTSVALSVPGGSIFGVSGSPVTLTGTLGLTITGTSGGIPYFSSSSALSTSAALTAHGVVIGGGAATAPTSTGSGTAGQVLTSNGASADPTFQAAGGGITCPTGFTQQIADCAWTQTASSSASLAFTGLVGQDYQLVCSNLVMSSGTNTLGVEIGEGGTPTYGTGANYIIQAVNQGFSGSQQAPSSGSASQSSHSFILAASTLNSGTLGTSATMNFHRLASTGISHWADWVTLLDIGGGGTYMVTSAAFYNADTNAITALRVRDTTSGANITSGTCTLRALGA